jgi:hypothetical protein
MPESQVYAQNKNIQLPARTLSSSAFCQDTFFSFLTGNTKRFEYIQGMPAEEIGGRATSKSSDEPAPMLPKTSPPPSRATQ